MSILVFGKTGQVARELARAPETRCLGRAAADLRDPAACARALRAQAPRAVINAAAYTAVDKAEGDAALAMRVNGDAPGAMAAVCADLGVPFVSISSDYVFDGSGDAPWAPDDPTGPLGVYGRTKLAGEQAIMAAGGGGAVLRTSWVVSSHGHNFVRTMLRLGRARDRLGIVADQIGGPTCARDIAVACLVMANALATAPEKRGIYHFAGTPDISWAGFARAIFAQAGIACDVDDIGTRDYPSPAARPLNSRLDCTSTETVFGLKRPDWRSGLHDILHALGEVEDE